MTLAAVDRVMYRAVVLILLAGCLKRKEPLPPVKDGICVVASFDAQGATAQQCLWHGANWLCGYSRYGMAYCTRILSVPVQPEAK